MRTFHRTLHLPHALILNSNDRHGHWGQRSGPTAQLRLLGNSHKRGIPQLERARITVTASYPDRRQRDSQNLYNTMKAYVDGLVDNVKGPDGKKVGGKGILIDDNDFFLIGPHLQWSGMLSDRRKEKLFRFDVLIEELEPVDKTIGEWDETKLLDVQKS